MYISYIPQKKPSVPFPPGPLCYTLGAPGPGVPATACAAATAERGLLRAEGMKAGTAGHGADCAAGTHLPEISDQNAMGIHGLYGDTMGIPWLIMVILWDLII